jgi:hypothetical protein
MIRPATGKDVLDLAPRLRAEDIQEIEALTGLGPLEALSIGLFHSDACMAAVGKDGKVCGLFGVSPYDETTASVWLLTSKEIVENAREVLKTGRAWLDEQQARYPVLKNLVSESNEIHIRTGKGGQSHLKGDANVCPSNRRGSSCAVLYVGFDDVRCLPRSERTDHWCAADRTTAGSSRAS